MLSFIFMIVACALASSNADPIESTTQGSFNEYYIYSSANPRDGKKLIITDEESVKLLDVTKNTIIIVHGHEGSAFTSLNPLVKDAALKSGDLNIIVVDWSVYAGQSYTNAVGAVPSIGKSLADLIKELVEKKAVSLDKLHLIGFDLGAHVVGFTGRALDGKVARITGLDPSGNQWNTNSQRLNKEDALYVEVIHTDGIGLGSHGVGDELGHVDFYANGGTGQPGCFLNNLCSHNRAWELMAASLSHNKLIGNACGNWHQVTLNICRGMPLTMGNNDFNKLGAGMFRVNTRRTYPFA